MVKFFTKTVCAALVMMLCVSSAFAQARESSTPPPAVQILNSSFALTDAFVNPPSRAAWDVLYSYDYTLATTGFYAPFYHNGQVLATRWNPTATGNALGKVYKFNISGTTLTPDGDFTIPGITGSYNLEDFCTDGTYFYSANETGKIFKIDPTTWTVASTITVSLSDVAPIAYDKASGGFWIASMFGSTATLVTSSGGSTGTTLSGVTNGIMGLAYDDVSEGGPYLWASVGSSATTNVAQIGRWKIGVNTFTNVHNVAPDFPLTGTGHSMGAMFEYEANGTFNFVALSQGQTKIIGYEVAPAGSGPTYCPVVTNVTAVQHVGTTAKITWTEPTDLTDFTGYKIYDGSEIGSVPAGTTTFITGNLTAGAHTFDVEANYSSGCTPKKVSATVTIKTCGGAITGVDVAYNDCKATVTWDAVAKSRTGVLFDGGPFITHPGQGSGGADVAAFGLSTQNSYGATAVQNTGWTIADDFTLANPSTLEKIEFYTYQTGSGTTPTITGVYVCIYDGNPMSGGNIIWGDQTTNRLDGVVFSNIYRVNYTAFTSTDRPLMKVTAGVDATLAAGTYWVGVSYNGTVSSGPWQNPVTILGQPQTGNGLQFCPPAATNPGWQLWTDSGTNDQCALPFVVYGDGGDPPAPKYNVYMDGVKVATEIEETTYTHPTAVTQGVDVEWCVTQACSGGGESEAGCMTKKCGEAPPPCNPVTGAAATIENCAKATLTWTAVEGAKEYKVTGANGTETVTTATYTEEGTFEHGVEYTWTIVTVCNDGESTGVEVKATADCEPPAIGELANSVAIFPNPVSGMITIDTKDFAKVEVYNTVGQLVETRTITKFDVSSYNTGIYFFKVYDNNNNSVTKRVMVTK